MKKKDNTLPMQNVTKRDKLKTEPYEKIDGSHQETYETKSICENNDENEDKIQRNRNKLQDFASKNMVVSPTFQTLSLKEQLYKNENYNIANFAFSLQDKQNKQREINLKDKDQNKLDEKCKELQQLIHKLEIEKKSLQNLAGANRHQLENHYSSMDFWSKMRSMFEKNDEDFSIIYELDCFQKKNDKLKIEKEKLKSENESLKYELNIKNEKVDFLEKQQQNDKNQTRVLTNKKCKGCDQLQFKEKQNFENYEKVKQLTSILQQKTIRIKDLEKKISDSEMAYKDLTKLKDEIERRRLDLAKQVESLKTKQKQYEEKFKTIQATEAEGRNILHIELEQLKESKHQYEKKLTKMEEKLKREINQAKEEAQEEMKIYELQNNRLRQEFNSLKAKSVKFELQKKDILDSLTIKETEFTELKSRDEEIISKLKGQVDEIKQKFFIQSEELRKTLELVDKSQFLFEQEKKQSILKAEELLKIQENAMILEKKLKQTEENEQRIKQFQNSHFNKPKVNQKISSNYAQRKLYHQSKEMYEILWEITGKQKQYQSRRKQRQFADFQDIRDDNFISYFETLQSSNISDLKYIANKIQYWRKDLECKDEEIQELKEFQEKKDKQIESKEEAVKVLIQFVPDSLKQLVLEMLELIENKFFEENQEFDQKRFKEIKKNLSEKSKLWKERYYWFEKKVQELQEENQELKSRVKGKDTHKKYAQQMESRDIYGKRQVRKKYEF